MATPSDYLSRFTHGWWEIIIAPPPSSSSSSSSSCSSSCSLSSGYNPFASYTIAAECDSPISRLHVSSWVPGDSVIYWEIDPAYNYPGSVHFYVDHARPGGPWECLNPDNPVIDSCSFIDEQKRNWGVQKQSYYRVRMVVPSKEMIYISQPQSIFGDLNRNDWLIAREVVRQKYLGFSKGDGQTGWLIKRRRWGVKCPSCLDYDTDERTNADCNRCYGVGILYGYFPAIPFVTATTNRQPRRKTTQENIGVTDPKTIQIECVAYPMLETEDVWVDEDTGERFFFQTISIQTSIRGVPLIYNAELRLAPFTHKVYETPLVGPEAFSSSLSSSSAATPIVEWRQGLSEDRW